MRNCRRLETVIKAASTIGTYPRRVLIVDSDDEVLRAVKSAVPGSRSNRVANVFEALFDLPQARYDAVLINLEPIEHRPEAAIASLREQIANAALPGPRPRLVLFGPAELEPIAQRMLNHGGDEYFLLPADSAELFRVLSQPTDAAEEVSAAGSNGAEASSASRNGSLAAETPLLLPDNLPLTAIVLDSLLVRPGAALAEAVKRISTFLPEGVSLTAAEGSTPSRNGEADEIASIAVTMTGSDEQLVLTCRRPLDEAERDVATYELGLIAAELAKLARLDARHAQLQKLALTDQLTGCYNRRYFEHFLGKILGKAHIDRFPVTLLLFDIDNFKLYNDEHGHQVGDVILRQTSELIRRCVRDHDLVARIGGDEFAVVFWEKDEARVPHDQEDAPASGVSRFPVGPLQIAERFRRLLCEPDFAALGPTGQGTLSISGGMAVYPYDAADAQALIEAADRALIFGAKRSGKNSIALVGSEGFPDANDSLGDAG